MLGWNDTRRYVRANLSQPDSCVILKPFIEFREKQSGKETEAQREEDEEVIYGSDGIHIQTYVRNERWQEKGQSRYREATEEEGQKINEQAEAEAGKEAGKLPIGIDAQRFDDAYGGHDEDSEGREPEDTEVPDKPKAN